MNGSLGTETELGRETARSLGAFGAKVAPAIARTLAAVTLAAGLAVGSTGTAAAASMTDPYLVCTPGSGTFSVSLPISSTRKMSQFAFRIDGGAWNYTPWYLTDAGNSWVWTGARWDYRGFGTYNAVLWAVDGSKYIEAVERRNYTTGIGAWFALERACWTTSMYGDPIRYH